MAVLSIVCLLGAFILAEAAKEREHRFAKTALRAPKKKSRKTKRQADSDDEESAGDTGEPGDI